jgi:hypothetical protein
VIIKFALLTIIWIAYETINYYYLSISETGEPIKVLDVIKLLCKVTAQLNILNFTFILLPIHKNSVWIYLFGCSFERSVKYHRWIGRWSFLMMTLHFFFECLQSAVCCEFPDLYIFYTG